VGAENGVTSCDLQVFVDQSAEAVASKVANVGAGRCRSCSSGWWLLIEGVGAERSTCDDLRGRRAPFGNTPRTADGGYGATAQAIRDVLDVVHVAEEVGLDFFGFGEHHTRSMPLSSPTALVNAAAASTQRMVGTAMTVLSTDEPIRRSPSRSSTSTSATTTCRTA
jgi:hypothetical protein